MVDKEIATTTSKTDPREPAATQDPDLGAKIAELTPAEYEEYCLCKKSLPVLAAEATASGAGLMLLSFLTCRSPLPMILAALELTQASGDQCAEVIRNTAIGTEATLFAAGVILSLVHNLVYPRIRLAWRKR